MLENKKGFLLLESLLLMEIMMLLSFVLFNTVTLFHQEESKVAYDAKREDTLIRQAYE